MIKLFDVTFISFFIFMLYLFFPSSVVQWNILRKLELKKKRIFEFIRPLPNSIFDIYNPYGIKLLTSCVLV